MMTRLPRLAVAAIVFSTLGLGGCSSGRSDEFGSPGVGISTQVPASETSLREAGIAS
jgi:hypothetical protein